MGQSEEYETTATLPDAVIEAPRKAIGKAELFSRLGSQCDERHYRKLEEKEPAIANTIIQMINAGVSPEEIHRWALGREEPKRMALRFLQSARYLASEGEGE